LTFQSVGLEFEARDIFRSRTLVVYGPVRSVDALAGGSLASDVDALAAAIMRSIKDDLADLVVEGATWEERLLIARVAEMFASDAGDLSLAGWNAIGQKVEIARAALAANDRSLYTELAAQVSAYYTELEGAGFGDSEVAAGKVVGKPGGLQRAVVLAAIFPLAVLGMALYFLPYQVPRLASRAADDADVVSTYKLGAGLVAHPLWASILGTTAFLTLPRPLAWTALAIVLVSPFAALAWLDRADRLQRRLRTTVLKTSSFERLQSSRRVVMDKLVTLARTLAVAVVLALLGTTPMVASAAPAVAPSPATDAVHLAPSRDGYLGAWLLTGPFKSATNGVKPRPPGPEALVRAPAGVDEAALDPRAPAWTLASSGEGPVDVKAALAVKDTDVVAYAAGTLHVQRGGRHYLMLGADDGARVSVDGKVVLVRDDARPERDDDDIVPLELAAGDHPIVLKLHQRDGAWSFRLRVLDAELAPPVGAYLELPGTHEADARALASKMSWISVDRGLESSGYAPKLTVRFPEGYPLGVPLPVRVRLTSPGVVEPLYDIALGEVPKDRGELVATLPALRGDDLPKIDDKTWAYEVDVVDRHVTPPFYPRRSLREAIAHLDRALATLPGPLAPPPAWLAHGSLESVLHLAERMVTFVAHGDGDLDAEKDEAKEIDQAAAAIEKQIDPYAARTGPVRRAYRSPVDDRLAEYGVYVPAGWRPGTKQRWPAVVMLHGLNGRPMSSLRHFFGGDDPKKEGYWEDRHALSPWPPLDAFVITPNGHGNTMYRQLGQDDILRVLDEVMATYPIDKTKVTITGPSMGGIGSAALALRHPDRFAAAAPLCGYHSYFVRRDFIGRPIRPWERFLAEERSNVFWAWNGQNLPLFIVHGTQDLPEA
ncbi:MAG: hypothetical protein JWM74_1604, partial [Myxococcaceae bacterium]|nr:hypothetical protein [Myxococcaceae bacterium]